MPSNVNNNTTTNTYYDHSLELQRHNQKMAEAATAKGLASLKDTPPPASLQAQANAVGGSAQAAAVALAPTSGVSASDQPAALQGAATRFGTAAQMPTPTISSDLSFFSPMQAAHDLAKAAIESDQNEVDQAQAERKLDLKAQEAKEKIAAQTELDGAGKIRGNMDVQFVENVGVAVAEGASGFVSGESAGSSPFTIYSPKLAAALKATQTAGKALAGHQTSDVEAYNKEQSAKGAIARSQADQAKGVKGDQDTQIAKFQQHAEAIAQFLKDMSESRGKELEAVSRNA